MENPNATTKPEAQVGLSSSALLAAADPFIRIVAISDSLPPHLKTDDCPLARHIPGVWPTLGELRKLVAEIQKPEACEEVARLTWALNKIIEVASGEDQVADDDTGGMAWIDKYARGVIGAANDQAQRPGLTAGVERNETKGKSHE